MHIADGYFRSFKEGREHGFNHFFKSYYKVLCFFANRYVKNTEASEEIVSESFMQLWIHRDKIETEAHLKNWLYKVVYRLCLQAMQKSKTQKQKLPESGIQDLESSERNILDNIIRTEVMAEIHQAIRQLPEECRKIFNKIYLQGKTVREIATELNLSINTVKTQRRRALQFLRSKLSPLSLLLLLLPG